MIDCKSTWYTQLKNNQLYPLNQNTLLINQKTLTDRNELVTGIRELNEGVFKYQSLDRYIELTDRMLFIGAHQQFDRPATLAERIKNRKKKTPYNSKFDYDLDEQINKLHMEITPEIRPLLNHSSKK